MATFTDSQITDIATILQINSDVLGDHLTFYASVITDTDKTKVLAKVTRWETAGSSFTSIEPNVKNFGARKNHDSEKRQIRREIAALLQAEELTSFGASSQGVIYRG